MDTSMLEYVLNNLERTKGKWPHVAKRAGVSYRTLQKIAQRLIEDPSISHIQKLHDYFQNEERLAA